MGQCLTSNSEPKVRRVLMVGLDGAGKTSILYRVKLGSVITAVPTIGFNREIMDHKGFKLDIWDVGGQKLIRPLWKHYYCSTNAIIFVIDSNDTERIPDLETYQRMSDEKKSDTVQFELRKLLKDKDFKNKKIPILVFANKSELTYSLNTQQIQKRLNFNETLIPYKTFLSKTNVKQYLMEEGIIKIVYDYLFWGYEKVELKNKIIEIVKCSGETGHGIYNGLDWLVKQLKNVKS